MHFLLALAMSVLGPARLRTPIDTIPVEWPSATLVGIVTDSLGNAIARGDVAIDGIRMAPTDRFGSFVVHVTANRRHLVQVRALGYVPESFSILASADDIQTVQIPLAYVATLLPGVAIRVHRDETDQFDPGLAGFEHRRETLGGSFFNTQQLKNRGYPPLSLLLRSVPGVTVTGHSVSMRGSGCAAVYLDGHPAPSESDIDDYVNTHELAAVEVYPSSAWVPVQFMGPAASCGTIVLWTADGLIH